MSNVPEDPISLPLESMEERIAALKESTNKFEKAMYEIFNAPIQTEFLVSKEFVEAVRKLAEQEPVSLRKLKIYPLFSLPEAEDYTHGQKLKPKAQWKQDKSKFNFAPKGKKGFR